MMTPLSFVKPLDIYKSEVPYELFGFPDSTSSRITNCQYMTVNNIDIQDVRTTSEVLSLDTAGFKFIRHKSNCPLTAEHFERAGSSVNGQPVVLAYLEETLDLVKNELGADKVLCCDWRFRRSGAPPSVLPIRDDTYDIRLQALAPGLDIHCDFSHQGGLERLQMHLLPEEFQAVKSGQWKAKIVNSWRPLNIVKNAPLVISDRRTVLQDDLLEVEKVLPDKVERNFYLKYKPYHKWFYMSDQGPEDVAIFTSWEEKNGSETAEFPPHGAASYFGQDFLENPRESIEVRVMAFTETSKI
ncbi:hypothetical protein V8C40DRAFT_274522 [Trichoderma camerunense]